MSTATWVASEADSTLSNKSLRTKMVWSTKTVMASSVQSTGAGPSNNREMTLRSTISTDFALGIYRATHVSSRASNSG